MASNIASSTSTRVDSASKHIVPCKVNSDYFVQLLKARSDNPIMELQHNKMKYCMHKDDVVIGVGRPLYAASINSTTRRAYPSVMTTIAPMHPIARRWMYMHNFICNSHAHSKHIGNIGKVLFHSLINKYGPENIQRAIAETKVDILDEQINEMKSILEYAQTTKVNENELPQIKFQIESLMEMYFVGVSLGLAYAHPTSGDNVASVMIGGLRTILNGHFQVHTNDMLMFYWDEEAALFNEDGSRKPRNIFQDNAAAKCEYVLHGTIAQNRALTTDTKERRTYYERGNGNFDTSPIGQVAGKDNVARIKPYIVRMNTEDDTFPLDKVRVFGKAISNARPFEPLDIMICRQSL